MDKKMLTIALLLWAITGTMAIIGYDCGSSNLNVTTLSLIDVGDCDIKKPEVEASPVYIQLLQLNEFIENKVIQCKVEIHRTIFHCGMNSHVSVVAHGQLEYLAEVTRDTCEVMHKSGMYRLGNSLINDLRVNQSTTHSITLAGSIKNDGSCYGTQYSDPYGSWDDVVVQGSVKVTLIEYQATVNLNTNRLNLKSGMTCLLTSQSCIDLEGGQTFWNALPVDNCKFNRYDVLYEGMAKKIKDIGHSYPQTVYTLSTQDITFALTKKSEQPACGHRLIRTEHPKLLIFETTRGATFAKPKPIAVGNLDIFAYVNSKFVYVEKHIRNQINQLYHDVLTQRCNLEQQVLTNALIIATQSPDEFAFHLMKGPGYMAVIAGEVVHIVKCIPVEVKVRRTQSCYHQLPVSRGNESLFLSPRTHIIMQTGTEITCDPLLPSEYLLGDAWYKLLPGPVQSMPPTIIKPMTKPTWKYTNPASLATSGIYTQEDLEKLRDHIMFPVEKPAVLNTLARGISGQPIGSQGISFSNMLGTDGLKNLVDSVWENMWGRFMFFGTASAGIIGIILLIRGIKLIVDTIIHGYALHTVYGWSIFLIGAIWDSVTHLLLHLKRNLSETPEMPSESTETHELVSVRIPTVQEEVQRVQERTESASVTKPSSSSSSSGAFSLRG